MSKEKVIKGLTFVSTVVVPVVTLAVGATLTFLKGDDNKNNKE